MLGLAAGVGDVAVDGGGAAGEGEEAVIGEGRRCGGCQNRDCAGVVERLSAVVEGSAGEGDEAGLVARPAR